LTLHQLRDSWQARVADYSLVVIDGAPDGAIVADRLKVVAPIIEVPNGDAVDGLGVGMTALARALPTRAQTAMAVGPRPCLPFEPMASDLQKRLITHLRRLHVRCVTGAPSATTPTTGPLAMRTGRCCHASSS
jgi:hypothetical protein